MRRMISQILPNMSYGARMGGVPRLAMVLCLKSARKNQQSPMDAKVICQARIRRMREQEVANKAIHKAMRNMPPHARVPTAKLSARAAQIRAQARAAMAKQQAEADEETAHFKNCLQSAKAKCTRKDYVCNKNAQKICNENLYRWLRARDRIPPHDWERRSAYFR